MARKAQMFVVTMIFLIGLIFSVNSLFFQYTALDLSTPFRENTVYLLQNTKGIINNTIKTTPNCTDFTTKMKELKDFLDRRIPRGGYSLSLSYKVNCTNWDSATNPPLNLTIQIVGKNADTSAMVFMYHVYPQASQSYPTGLSLSQTPNMKQFSVSWSAGTGNGGAGGCKLQFSNGASWTDITSAGNVNCDATASSVSYDLNADGWKSGWGGTQVRLVRKSDSTVMGTFPQTLVCTSGAGSSSPTPTKDEDCNGYWDNTGTYVCDVSGAQGKVYYWITWNCPGSAFDWWWGNCYSSFSDKGCANRGNSCPFCDSIHEVWEGDSCCLSGHYPYY